MEPRLNTKYSYHLWYP